MATGKLFGQVFIKALNKEISCVNGATNLKVMLTTSTLAPDQDAWVYKSSVTNEVSTTGTGYAAATLTSVTVAYTAGTNLTTIDAADTVWSGVSFTFRYAIIYDSTSTNFPLIAFVDFGADTTVSNGNLTIQWDGTGIATVTVA